MRHFKLVVLVGFVVVFAIAGAASAQGKNQQGAPGRGCEERFKAMDADHDGKLTKDEFMAAPHYRDNPEQVFNSMDSNRRGYITPQEFCAGKGRGRGMGSGGNQQQ